jgi:hypothetical protein
MKKIIFIIFIILFLTSCFEEDLKPKPTPKPEIPEINFTTEEYLNICNLEFSCQINADTDDDLNACLRETITMLNLPSNSKVIETLHMEDSIDRFKLYLDCANKAKDCTEYESCLGIISSSETCDSTYVDKCDGKVAKHCNIFGKVIKTDCTYMDFTGYETCVVREDYSAWNNEQMIAECVTDYGECDDYSYTPTCNGNKMLGCSNGKITEMDCEFVTGKDSTCKTTTMMGRTFGMCTPPETAEDCDDENYNKICYENKIKSCMMGKVIEQDCKVNYGDDYLCNVALDEDINCVHKSVATSWERVPYCEGDILKYTINGVVKEFDCKANGYSSCIDDELYNNDLIPAYCKN